MIIVDVFSGFAQLLPECRRPARYRGRRTSWLCIDEGIIRLWRMCRSPADRDIARRAPVHYFRGNLDFISNLQRGYSFRSLSFACPIDDRVSFDHRNQIAIWILPKRNRRPTTILLWRIFAWFFGPAHRAPGALCNHHRPRRRPQEKNGKQGAVSLLVGWPAYPARPL